MVKKRTIELQMTHDQLLHAEKLSAIGNMSASIAHEFNNPLYGIQNVLKGIKKRAPLENEDADLLNLALKECTRIKELIQDIQDFNRPSNSVVAPIDVHKTIDNMLMLLTLELKNKKIVVEKNYATNMPSIRAVGDQIKQVLLNMFNNAIYTLSDNKGVISISTEILNKQRVAIHIRDSGKGIEPEDMDHIFEPFFTTKDETDGTGLGLSVSFGIIKRHGGKITANSKVGKGTTFTIILPIDGLPI